MKSYLGNFIYNIIHIIDHDINIDNNNDNTNFLNYLNILTYYQYIHCITDFTCVTEHVLIIFLYEDIFSYDISIKNISHDLKSDIIHISINYYFLHLFQSTIINI